MYKINIPQNLIKFSVLDTGNIQYTANDEIIQWLKENTPTYKLENNNFRKVAVFQQSDDIIWFKLRFDLPGDIFT